MIFDHPSDGQGQFRGSYNHALAFAARATSSFPGAFPPISIADYERAVPEGQRLREVLPKLFPHYSLAPANPEKTQFVDGGVLDNAPFGSTIRAIRDRRAGVEVDRRLLYIQPDPRETAAGVLPGEAPSWLGTIWGSVASIPRQEPILDDLLDLAERNETVMRIRDIIETSFSNIERKVGEVASRDLGWERLDLRPQTPTL